MLLHCYGNDFAGDRRVVWDVVVVAEHELERVFTCWQCQRSFGLAVAEVTVFIVGG